MLELLAAMKNLQADVVAIQNHVGLQTRGNAIQIRILACTLDASVILQCLVQLMIATMGE